VEQRPDGLVRITLKKAYRDGTVAVDMDPLSLLCRLATSTPEYFTVWNRSGGHAGGVAEGLEVGHLGGEEGGLHGGGVVPAREQLAVAPVRVFEDRLVVPEGVVGVEADGGDRRHGGGGSLWHKGRGLRCRLAAIRMSLLADDIRRAYAVFGLRPGAPPAQVRRRYKALARQWHPDRHAREPRNQAEAASRMQEINAAYRPPRIFPEPTE
jgi:hypothetical protein